MKRTCQTNQTVLFGIIVCLAALTRGSFSTASAQSPSSFPDRPIKIVVYMKPGGLADTTTRRFVDVARKYTDATFVVENKPGSGGIIAIRDVLGRPADGYTLCAVTKSNVPSLLAAGKSSYFDELDWIALLMHDPECVITLRDGPISDWQDLVRSKQQEQIWVGPSKGGLDHVVALKLWDRFGIHAKWLPFESGGEAKVALLGQQGVAYVGNPDDAAGNDAFKIAAISHSQRLPQFPDVPTFGELGVPSLDAETMWRGFALRSGCTGEVKQWYADLFRQVSNDPQWRETWEPSGMDVVFVAEKDFESIVELDRSDFVRYLGRLDMLADSQSNDQIDKWNARSIIGGVVTWLLLAAVTMAIARRRRYPHVLSLLLPTLLIAVCVTLWSQTIPFAGREMVGAEVVPRIWMLALLAACVWILIIYFWSHSQYEPPTSAANRSTISPWPLVLGFAVYTFLLMKFGYFLSTALALPTMIIYLGYRRWLVVIMTTLAWLVFSYVVFVRVLLVPLPIGEWLESWGVA
ncbi:MAG: tripartite tricarboxylate transporter substrate-binding protein [Pirellulaceae bacterium]